MQIITKASGITMTDAIAEYIDKRVSGLQKLIDPADTTVRAQVEIGKSVAKQHTGDEVYRAEINLTGARLQCYAVAEGSTLYAAIDQVKDEIMSELRKNKQKRRHLLRRGGAKLKNLFRWGSEK